MCAQNPLTEPGSPGLRDSDPNARSVGPLIPTRRTLRRSRSAACIAEIAKTINLAGPLRETLYTIARNVTATLGYKAAGIWLLDPVTDVLSMEVAYGLGIEYIEQSNRIARQLGPNSHQTVRLAMRSGRPIVREDVATHPQIDGRVRALAGRDRIGGMIAAPLSVQNRPIGSMACYVGHPHRFSPEEIRLVSTVAHQVAIFIENARLYEQARRLAIMEERERIGHDLHDWIIQSIYATSLKLEKCLQLIDPQQHEMKEKITQAIDSLGSIRLDIRSYIMDLRRKIPTELDLSDGLSQVVREFAVACPAQLDVALDESGVGLSHLEVFNLISIAREALANVSKHASATRVSVSLQRREDDLVLTIEDNGIGFHPTGQERRRGVGLDSIESRVRSIGAILSLSSTPGQGTRIEVRLTPHSSETPD